MTARRSFVIIGALLAVAVARAQSGPPTRQQIEEINRYFTDRTITARMDLPVVRSVYVTPDGQFDEARYRERLAMQPASILRDETGKLSKIEVEKDRIEVLINRGGMRPPKGRVLALFGGRKRVGSRIEIEFGRRLTQSDLTPEAIVRAVSRVISIEGVDAATALARPGELLAPAAAGQLASRAGAPAPPAAVPRQPASQAVENPPPPPVAASFVELLSAESRPARVRPGENLTLVIHYVVKGTVSAALLEVTEERQLFFEGKPLFSQAVSTVVARRAGNHSSTFDLVVPAAAQPGVYTFAATIRAGGRSATREALLQISR